MRAPRHDLLLLLIALPVVVFDLLSKWLVRMLLDPSQPLALVGDDVRLILVHNTGTAFGLFPGRQLAFVLFSGVAVVAILLLYRGLARRSARQVVSMGLLLGGAAGNVHDRLRFGEVTDFIQVGIGGHYWPVFNLADAAISIGVALLALSLLRRRPAPAETAAAP